MTPLHVVESPIYLFASSNLTFIHCTWWKWVGNCKEIATIKTYIFNLQPKARQMTNTKYGSLPSNSPPRMFGQQTSGDSGIGGPEECTMGSNGGRNVLGMGISAVHDAVLRGFAKLPGKFHYYLSTCMPVCKWVFGTAGRIFKSSKFPDLKATLKSGWNASHILRTILHIVWMLSAPKLEWKLIENFSCSFVRTLTIYFNVLLHLKYSKKRKCSKRKEVQKGRRDVHVRFNYLQSAAPLWLLSVSSDCRIYIFSNIQLVSDIN